MKIEYIVSKTEKEFEEKRINATHRMCAWDVRLLRTPPRLEVLPRNQWRDAR
jgi:hypothetical protein